MVLSAMRFILLDYEGNQFPLVAVPLNELKGMPTVVISNGV